VVVQLLDSAALYTCTLDWSLFASNEQRHAELRKERKEKIVLFSSLLSFGCLDWKEKKNVPV
jgi:thermostable 8-oxoguanine DNA glycosylase